MPETNREGFLQGIRVLEEVSAAKKPFNMGVWSRPHLTTSKLEHPYENCGTAACAAGWMCRDKWFKDRGIRLHKIGGYPVYKGMVSFTALKDFFGISWEEAHTIFCSLSYTTHNHYVDITPEDVIEKMKTFL